MSLIFAYEAKVKTLNNVVNTKFVHYGITQTIENAISECKLRASIPIDNHADVDIIVDALQEYGYKTTHIERSNENPTTIIIHIRW